MINKIYKKTLIFFIIMISMVIIFLFLRTFLKNRFLFDFNYTFDGGRNNADLHSMLTSIFILLNLVLVFVILELKTRIDMKNFYFNKNMVDIGKKLLFLSSKNSSIGMIDLLKEIELNNFFIVPKNRYTINKFLEPFLIKDIIYELKRQLPDNVKFKFINEFIQINKNNYIVWYKILFVFLIRELILSNSIMNDKKRVYIIIKEHGNKFNFVFSYVNVDNVFLARNVSNLLWLCKRFDAKVMIDSKRNQVILSIEKNMTHEKLLIKKDNGQFIPLFTKKEVSRDNFFHLRKQLINFGLNSLDVIQKAKDISKKVLEINDDEKYSKYILNDTYKRCHRMISHGYKFFPIQDPYHPLYSHIELFSSIYGFEMDYLKYRMGITGGKVADIGCGDGLFIKILDDFLNIKADGYDITIPDIRHKYNLTGISNYNEIKENYKFIILNHVIEHVIENPADFILGMMNYFNSISVEKIDCIILSIPYHRSLEAHQASKHNWIFNSKKYHLEEIERINRLGMKTINFKKEMTNHLVGSEYKLLIYKSLGMYIIQKYDI